MHDMMKFSGSCFRDDLTAVAESRSVITEALVRQGESSNCTTAGGTRGRLKLRRIETRQDETGTRASGGKGFEIATCARLGGGASLRDTCTRQQEKAAWRIVCWSCNCLYFHLQKKGEVLPPTEIRTRLIFFTCSCTCHKLN